MDVLGSFRNKNRKARCKQTLQTESLTVAETRVLPLVHQWKRLIEAARSNNGSLVSLTNQFRVHAERLKNAGVPDHEIQMAQEDIAVELAEADFD